jgi:predicted CDP-diglyceride synthetase/phosphatidate cytidylyltransferase
MSNNEKNSYGLSEFIGSINNFWGILGSMTLVLPAGNQYAKIFPLINDFNNFQLFLASISSLFSLFLVYTLRFNFPKHSILMAISSFLTSMILVASYLILYERMSSSYSSNPTLNSILIIIYAMIAALFTTSFTLLHYVNILNIRAKK